MSDSIALFLLLHVTKKNKYQCSKKKKNRKEEERPLEQNDRKSLGWCNSRNLPLTADNLNKTLGYCIDSKPIEA